MESLERVLSGHPFAKGLETRFLKILVGCASNVVFEADSFMFHEGEDANQFYIIRKGKVALEIHDSGRGPVSVETLTEGEVVGWSWLVPPYHWHFDGHVIERIQAIALDAKCLRKKCNEDHSLGYELLMRIVPLITHRLQSTRIQLMDIYGTRD